MPLTRRAALTGAATLPLALAGASVTQAAAPMMGIGSAPFRRVKLGDFEVTTILAGTRPVPDPQKIFGMNVSADEFTKVSANAHIPIDVAQFFFTPTVVNTGAELILFDSGLSGPATTTALASAGYAADDIDAVVITHMHGDHIGGLMTGNSPTFPNARYITGSVEYDAWEMSGNDLFEANMVPLAERTTFIDPGTDVSSGITSVEAYGHTPGHMAYMLESGGKQLLLAADTANHYVWSLAYPDWEVRFDKDKAAAAATRRKIMGMLAADKIPMVGYHMPWPGIGYVDTHADGFHFVPQSYQLML
ncbi:MAG: glyoxylase-like metal-dependent hydrolase (beta-lactamase superfamily II) [Paracoccaceae bacterium]|jgi:glyoxylase-like metal-dependent hydrolase (beta-lactamase superfamily II)